MKINRGNVNDTSIAVQTSLQDVILALLRHNDDVVVSFIMNLAEDGLLDWSSVKELRDFFIDYAKKADE